jgi:uncharacterized protein (TIGR02300 family)
MGKLELGTKCTCTGCGQRFYDLNRSPGVCPKCGVEQPPEKPRVLRPPRSSFGTRRPYRQDPVFAAEEAEPAVVSEVEEVEAEDGDAVPEPDDEVDDDVEIVPGITKEVD